MAFSIAPRNWYRYRWSCTLGTGPGATRRSSNTQALEAGIERFNKPPQKNKTMNFEFPPKKMGKFSEVHPDVVLWHFAQVLFRYLKKKRNPTFNFCNTKDSAAERPDLCWFAANRKHYQRIFSSTTSQLCRAKKKIPTEKIGCIPADSIRDLFGMVIQRDLLRGCWVTSKDRG